MRRKFFGVWSVSPPPKKKAPIGEVLFQYSLFLRMWRRERTDPFLCYFFAKGPCCANCSKGVTTRQLSKQEEGKDLQLKQSVPPWSLYLLQLLQALTPADELSRKHSRLPNSVAQLKVRE